MIKIISRDYFLGNGNQNILPIIFFTFIFVSSTAYISVYATPNLDHGSNNNNAQQLLSESENMRRLDSINNSDTSNVISSSLNAPHAGSLQIPYSGLVTESISPAFAEILNLGSTTRGKIVTHIIPGSPAEKSGMQPLNTTRPENTEEIKASGGDIIFTVDGGTTFATDYDSLEQYIYDNKSVGENVTLTILRDGQVKDIEMTIEALPRFLWYENRDEGIRMKYPSDWTVAYERSMVGEEIVKFLTMEKSALYKAPVASVSVLRYLSDITDGSNIIKSSESDNISNVRILNTNTTSLDNSRAYVSIFYDYSQKNHTSKVLTVFAVRDAQVYRIDFSADPLRYDDYFPLATEMMKSFQFVAS
ncbi:MAG: PDZ domain-containing protein [Nitrososphaeraceae archaeon]